MDVSIELLKRMGVTTYIVLKEASEGKRILLDEFPEDALVDLMSHYKNRGHYAEDIIYTRLHDHGINFDAQVYVDTTAVLDVPELYYRRTLLESQLYKYTWFSREKNMRILSANVITVIPYDDKTLRLSQEYVYLPFNKKIARKYTFFQPIYKNPIRVNLVGYIDGIIKLDDETHFLMEIKHKLKKQYALKQTCLYDYILGNKKIRGYVLIDFINNRGCIILKRRNYTYWEEAYNDLKHIRCKFYSIDVLFEKIKTFRHI